MVTPDANHNKYYRMIPKGDTFEVQWGRVGNENYQSDTYPISLWDKKLNEKLRKGYVDQTRLVAKFSEKTTNGYARISNSSISAIIERLQAMAKQAIADNYTISSNRVSQAMIDEAQALISQLKMDSSTIYFNKVLVDLFTTIPRKMKRVIDELANTREDFKRIVQREQDLLDIMRGQVYQEVVEDIEEISTSSQKTILETLGLQFFETTPEEKEIVKGQLRSVANQFSNAWKVVNTRTQEYFDDYITRNNITNKKLLWHGSRNENWWSIINSGLVLRPNAVTTGKMFGYGIYFAPSAKKSFGYTSYRGSYWAGGNANVAFMSLFDVAYGKPYDVYSHNHGLSSMTYDALQRACPGANSLHAHEGQMLHADEIVVYQESQITIKYLVELK